TNPLPYRLFQLPPPPPLSTLFPYTTLFRSARRPLRGSRRLEWPDAPRSSRRGHAQGLHQTKEGRGGGFLSPPRAEGSSREDRGRSEEHTSELQSLRHLVCRLLLEKKKRPQ